MSVNFYFNLLLKIVYFQKLSVNFFLLLMLKLNKNNHKKLYGLCVVSVVVGVLVSRSFARLFVILFCV